jgi:hypothetical protein
MTDFAYTDEQWDGIADSIADVLDVDVDDTDLIRRGGASLRDLIEIEAGMFCERGSLNRREAERQAHIDKLVALRDELRGRLVPTLASTTDVNADDMLVATAAYVDRLTRRIDCCGLKLSGLERGRATNRQAMPPRPTAMNSGSSCWRSGLRLEVGVPARIREGS